MANAYHAPKKSSRKKKNVELFDVDDLEAGKEEEVTEDYDDYKKKKDKRRSTIPPPSNLSEVQPPQTPEA